MSHEPFPFYSLIWSSLLISMSISLYSNSTISASGKGLGYKDLSNNDHNVFQHRNRPGDFLGTALGCWCSQRSDLGQIVVTSGQVTQNFWRNLTNLRQIKLCSSPVPFLVEFPVRALKDKDDVMLLSQVLLIDPFILNLSFKSRVCSLLSPDYSCYFICKSAHRA